MDEKGRDSYYYEDVIDLRELVQTLWDARWIILGVTLAAALTAFLVSSFLLPPQYQAEAMVTLLEPNLRVELESSIRSGEVRLDASGLPDLAEAQVVQERVFTDLGISDQEQRGSYEFAAALVGGDQLQLGVNAREPERAAQAANAWAAVLVEDLNELYGEGEASGQALEGEVERARENWQTAQAALEGYLPENQVESLRVELAAAKSRLALYQAKADQIRLLQIDLEGLRSQLVDIPDGNRLSNPRYLALVALQQRAVQVDRAAYYQTQGMLENRAEISQETIIDGVQSQTGSIEINLPESGVPDLTAAEARSELESLGTALSAAGREVLELASGTALEINQLRVELELEEYQLAELTGERDLARQAYSALRGQLEENRISRAQQASPARIGAEAVAPEKPAGPRTLLNTALAGIVGGMLAVGGVLIVDWWSNDER